jgi:hypothetical protein
MFMFVLSSGILESKSMLGNTHSDYSANDDLPHIAATKSTPRDHITSSLTSWDPRVPLL